MHDRNIQEGYTSTHKKIQNLATLIASSPNFFEMIDRILLIINFIRKSIKSKIARKKSKKIDQIKNCQKEIKENRSNQKSLEKNQSSIN